RPRSDMSLLRRGLKPTLIAAAAWFSVPTLSDAGAIVDYGFSGASAVLNGQPVFISGLVGVALVAELYAQIQLTVLRSFAGLYTVPFTGDLSPVPPETFVATRGNEILTIGYANDLSLTSVAITGGFGTVVATATTGTAVIVGTSIGYTFSNGASTTINGVLEQISGSFEFDPLTQIEWEAMIQLIGPAPYAGSCFFSTQLAPPGNTIYANCPQLGGITRFNFENDLSTIADPLVNISFL